MFALTTVVLAWTQAAAFHLPVPALHADITPPPSALTDVALPTVALDPRADAWRLGLAQPAPHPAAAEPAAAADTAAEACDVDCETAHEDARTARFVMRNRARTLRWHRGFAIAAWSTFVVTEVLGTIQAVNQPTWFGNGNCSSNPESFGCHQSSMISGLHETFAIGTTALYTTAGILAIAAPDPEHAAEGTGQAQSTLRLHKTLAWVHGVGMILLPIMGVLTAHPQILGINEATQADFSRGMRTVHTVLGWSTFAALTWSAYLEIF